MMMMMMKNFSELEIEVARQLIQLCKELRHNRNHDSTKKTKHEEQEQITTGEDKDDGGFKASNKEALTTMMIEDEDEEEEEEGEYYENVLMRSRRKRRFRSVELIYRSTKPLVKLVVSDNVRNKKKTHM
ncbi:hypothetical protein ACOSQ3_004637 [Xanthoceras sorbifolium]